MNKVYLESSKKIRNPSEVEIEAGRTTVYDTWKYRYPDSAYPDKPR